MQLRVYKLLMQLIEQEYNYLLYFAWKDQRARYQRLDIHIWKVGYDIKSPV